MLTGSHADLTRKHAALCAAREACELWNIGRERPLTLREFLAMLADEATENYEPRSD